MEIDSGARPAVISKQCYENFFSHAPLITSKVTLRTYNKLLIPSLGYLKITAERNGIKNHLISHVVKQGGPPLLGRNWLQAFGLWPIRFQNNMHAVVTSKLDSSKQTVKVKNTVETERLKREFPKIFEAGIGTFTKGELILTLKEEARLKFLQPRKIPWALREKVARKLSKLEALKINFPVEYSDWGSPVMLVLKSDGSVRLCGDFKVTLNKYLEIDHYPLPKVEEVLETLRRGELFTKLDPSEAYQQLPLAKDSKKLVVISTHLGLFQYNRYPMGYQPARDHFRG
ncbi:uncharacterized protein LOC124183886 [Neodiprion fabricii]|uniref:uncharacterized protein LOC124183886 n=1 Tax=Neodiprion fabricii TaxID=2872261 RepID=UPI001ED948C4|nr:uncharacterized protein LOC124183886 [Neodiprion fabricii]